MNHRRKIALVVLSALVLDVSAASPAPGRPAATAQTRWTGIEANLGAARLDGTLNYRAALGGSRELELLGLRLELVHTVETDAQGRARSAWRFPGLESSVVPVGREHLRWQPPAGPARQFERKGTGRAFPTDGRDRWLIREPRPGRWEVRSPDGGVWRYDSGALTEIDHPQCGPLSVATQGVWITRIARREAAPSESALLEAAYSPAGRLRRLQIGRQTVQEFDWNEAGELVAWRRSGRDETRWKYEAGLLCEIAESSGPAKEVRWRENPGHDRGDSRWPAPVHVEAVGGEQYLYEFTSRGFLLTRVAPTGAEVVTRFNPRRQRLEQVADGARMIAIFRATKPGGGGLQRIETGDGRKLEEYFYDEAGRLSAIERAGQPRLELHYDELGRLLDVGERSSP